MVTETRTGSAGAVHWALLVYRLPREPSGPRLALWRAVRRLGAIQIGDGIVALPSSPRNLEHLEWLAAGIRDDSGSATVWAATPTSSRANKAFVEARRGAGDDE